MIDYVIDRAHRNGDRVTISFFIPSMLQRAHVTVRYADSVGPVIGEIIDRTIAGLNRPSKPVGN